MTFTLIMPVRGSRRLYLLNEIQLREGTGENATTRAILAKIKQPIAEYFGLTPVNYNDPIFTATFGGEGGNAGARFRKNLGGFRDASYTLIAENNFQINERVDDGSGNFTAVESLFKTVSIGLPKGHSVSEVIDWIATFDNFDNIRALRTPKGNRIELFTNGGGEADS